MDASKIYCDFGYNRTATTSFVCDCLMIGERCEIIAHACEEIHCAPNQQVGSGEIASSDCAGGALVDEPTCAFSCEAGLLHN